MDARGGHVERLTHSGQPYHGVADFRGLDGHPTWSPDGRHIAFCSRRDGDLDLYVVPADGGETQRLTDTPEDEWDPEWSR